MRGLPESYVFKTPTKTATIPVDGFDRVDDALSGLYVFRGKYSEFLYVGQTKSFRKRFASHLTSSPFSRLIYRADIYRVDDPYMREIFETVFINELRPYYNRAKSFAKGRASHDAVLFEIESLEGERQALEGEKVEILDAVDRSDDYIPEEDYTDYDEALRYMLGEDLRAVERLPEIDAEIRLITQKINLLYRKIS